MRSARRLEAAAAALLVVVGVAAYAPHILHGGWYMDDWRDAAVTQYHSLGGALHWFAGYTDERPLLILYLPLKHALLGEHMHVDIAWSVLLGAAMSVAFYALLRELGLARPHAWLLAALALLFPFSDSTRLWSTASLAPAAVALYLAGAAVSVHAVRERRRALHAAGLALYAASLLTYEVSIAAVALTGALYLVVAPWERVRRRWAADVVVAVACGAWVLSHTKYQTLTFAQQLQHAREIAAGGLLVLAHAAQPFGAAAPRGIAAAVVAAVLAAAALAWWRAREPVLGRWLLVAGGGLAAAVAGWVVYIPADPYYTPYPGGMPNRVNVFAALGVVTLLYAALALAGQLAVRAWRRPRARWWLAPALGALVLGAGYARTLRQDERTWDRAFRAEMDVLGRLKAVVPHPPRDATILTFNYPGYETLGVPIFGADWDLNGAVKMQYDRGDLTGYPMLGGVRLACGARGLAVTGDGYDTGAAYGRLVLVDVPRSRVAEPRTQDQCRRSMKDMPPGPLAYPE